MNRNAVSMWLLSLGMLGLVSGCSPAEEVRIAVASNFSGAIREIATDFREATGQEVRPVFSSTGKHFAQITNGAPFAAFLAADVERPRLLEERGVAVPGSRFTYALGTLVLWSPTEGFIDGDGKVLQGTDFRFLAVASPKLAPYGAAARQVLEHMGIWEELQPKIVRGENIAQTFQYVASGNAELGFVAASQLEGSGRAHAGSRWLVPDEMHDPIAQQAVLLREDPVARAFLAYLKSEEARAVMLAHGYRLP